MIKTHLFIVFISLFLGQTTYIPPKNVTPSMIFVQGGEFIMGSVKENTAHKVAVASFYISQYEITLAQYQQFLLATGHIPYSERKSGKNNLRGELSVEVRDSLLADVTAFKETVSWYADGFGNDREEETFIYYPVSYVLWVEAVAYCNWLSRLTGETYRLPTAAEWEYAAKGGLHWTDNFTYAGSNHAEEVAWFPDKGYKRTIHPIGKKKPNQLGLYDMSGNVAEWCLDYYQDDYHLKTSYKNPLCMDSTINSSGTNSGAKLAKGGSFTNDIYYCETSINYPMEYEQSKCAMGFRIVKEVKKYTQN